MSLAVVCDLCEFRDPVLAEELEQFETDVLARFVLARASAGLVDGAIRGDVRHLDQMRARFGRPLWDVEPADADGYFGKVLRDSPSGTRLARAQALTTYFLFVGAVLVACLGFGSATLFVIGLGLVALGHRVKPSP
ncbi:hypothetical protein ACH4S8_42350 [Streptomyces sp. NPDC021080]|uniref:hypothetical protein n=1 Tax=Streptomyces sp. NPDC021080 TaxID=3365110 RepID=UPI0037B2B496